MLFLKTIDHSVVFTAFNVIQWLTPFRFQNTHHTRRSTGIVHSREIYARSISSIDDDLKNIYISAPKDLFTSMWNTVEATTMMGCRYLFSTRGYIRSITFDRRIFNLPLSHLPFHLVITNNFRRASDPEHVLSKDFIARTSTVDRRENAVRDTRTIFLSLQATTAGLFFIDVSSRSTHCSVDISCSFLFSSFVDHRAFSSSRGFSPVLQEQTLLSCRSFESFDFSLKNTRLRWLSLLISKLFSCRRRRRETNLICSDVN